MTTNVELTALVEAHWRTILTLCNVDPNASVQQIFDFEKRINNYSQTLSPTDSATYLNHVWAMRESLATEARIDHIALRVRLGLPPTGNQNLTTFLANLETPTSLNPQIYLNNFWRNALTGPQKKRSEISQMYNEFVSSLTSMLSSFSQIEQDAFMSRIVVLNSTYLEHYKTNPDLVRREIGLPPSQTNQAQTLGETIVKTAIDAAIGKGISSIFNIFR